MKGILTDETGDLVVRYGGLVIGNVDAQIAEHVIIAFKGEYKEVPMLGGEVRKMLSGTPDPFWRGNIKTQLKSQFVDADINVNVNDGNVAVTIK